VKGDDIADRLLRFAKNVICLCRSFPNDPSAAHIARQLVRAATSAGSNYEEARGAESRADFSHKLGVSRKELREAVHWLRLSTPEFFGEEVGPLIREGNELVAILTSSIKTLAKRSKA
jgi:four helix bundle protein